MPKSTEYEAKQPDADGFIGYTPEEDAVWADLVARQMPAVRRDMARPYLDGLAKLDLPTARVPQCPEVSERLRDLTGAGRARLINDLIALGYATPALSGEAAGFLTDPPPEGGRNGQRLVVNAGTGFNVCAVRVLPGGAITVLEAEEGHTHLPANIMARLQDRVGTDAAAGFFSTDLMVKSPL